MKGSSSTMRIRVSICTLGESTLKRQEQDERGRAVGKLALLQAATVQGDDPLGERPLDTGRRGLKSRRPEAPLDAEHGFQAAGFRVQADVDTSACGRAFRQTTTDREKHCREPRRIDQDGALLPAAPVTDADGPS